MYQVADPTVTKIWVKVLEELKIKYDSNAYNTFFAPTIAVGVENNNTFIISVNTRFAQEVINRKFATEITEILKSVSETNFILQVKLANEINLDPNKKINSENNHLNEPFKSNLNPNFLFDNFVVGKSNQECNTAAFAAALEPGKFYNPLFIYGKSGLGKTHLLHAIGNYVRESQNKTFNIYYTTAEDFVDEFIRSARNNDVDALKNKFKSIDVLLLDDVQFFAGKDKTSEVFFYIFNTLFNEKKQIVLTSDRNPNELRNLEDRLVSRFASGLTVGMLSPEFDTACEILKRKIVANNLGIDSVDEEVLKYIANNFSSNVRQLEGALNRLFFYATTINKEKIDLNLAIDAFEHITPSVAGKSALTIEKIKTIVAENYNLSISQLVSKVRTNTITIPRHIAIYLGRSMLNITYEELGSEFGNRDHTTIMNACLKVENLLKTDKSYVIAIENIKKALYK